jgi:hypothetical protein
MNLAYAELFYGFAYIFRKYEMQMAEGMTEREIWSGMTRLWLPLLATSKLS